MNELDRYGLADLSFAVEKQYSLATRNKTPVNKPKAYILGGQPGAGKSTLQTHIEKEQPNTVAINGDAYRRRHPHYDEIYEAYGDDAANHTQPFANAVASALVDKLSTDGYNIVIEGTCRRADVPLKTCKDLKEKGYEVELMIICCDENVAWQSTIDRYNAMQNQGKRPRAVPRDKFVETVEKLPDNVDELYRSGEFAEITLYDREMNELYRMTNTPLLSPKSTIYTHLHSDARNLHFGQLVKGVKVYDVSRTDPVTNNYPTVAYISEEGRVALCVDDLADIEIENIEKVAKTHREVYKQKWDKMSLEYKYEKILDRASEAQFIEIANDPLRLAERIKKYENSLIFGTEEFPLAHSSKSVNYLLSDKEKQILENANKIQQNHLNDYSFSEQVNKYLSGNMKIYETLSLGETPNVLRLVGATGHTLIVPQNVIKNCMLDETGKAKRHFSGHNLSEKIIKQIPEQIRNPIMIIEGHYANTIVVITELEDKDSDKIIVPISMNIKGPGNSAVNKITSIYGKDDIGKYLVNHQNQLLAYNKEKTDKLCGDIGVQFPKLDTAICFDSSIAYTTENVKYPLTEKEKIFMETNLAADIASHSLAWDEVESIGYIMYDKDHRKKYKPSSNSSYGLGGLKETELYELLDKKENGEDVTKEFVFGLSGLGVKNLIMSVGGSISDSLSIEPEQRQETENGYILKYGNAEREVSFKELEKAYEKRISEEYQRLNGYSTKETAISNIVKTFFSDSSGEITQAGEGDWRIAKGGYDLVGEVYHNNTPVCGITYTPDGYEVNAYQQESRDVAQIVKEVLVEEKIKLKKPFETKAENEPISNKSQTNALNQGGGEKL